MKPLFYSKSLSRSSLNLDKDLIDISRNRYKLVLAEFSVFEIYIIIYLTKNMYER